MFSYNDIEIPSSTKTQGCIWAAHLGKWRRKIATGARFRKQCARYGALISLRAHFVKIGAPDFHMLFIFFENIISLLLCQLVFVYEVHYAGWPASGKIRVFHNQF